MLGSGRGSRALDDLLLGTSIVREECVTKLFVLLCTAVLDTASHCQLPQVAFQLLWCLLTLSRPHAKKTMQDLLCVGNAMLMACSDHYLHLLMDSFCAACNWPSVNWPSKLNYQFEHRKPKQTSGNKCRVSFSPTIKAELFKFFLRGIMVI